MSCHPKLANGLNASKIGSNLIALFLRNSPCTYHNSPMVHNFLTAEQLRKLNVQFVPSEKMPALQYLDSVEKGSVSDKAGLRAGDFILEVSACYSKYGHWLLPKSSI